MSPIRLWLIVSGLSGSGTKSLGMPTPGAVTFCRFPATTEFSIVAVGSPPLSYTKTPPPAPAASFPLTVLLVSVTLPKDVPMPPPRTSRFGSR